MILENLLQKVTVITGMIYQFRAHVFSCRYSCVALHRTVGCARNRQTNIIIPSTDSINNRRSKHATPFPENNRVLK